ncbi:MAG TPA: arginyltransferase [Rudaea sp.]|jgi:arginine-tRNA-protein transferase|nr:arginyltransferase [Rudaea sp.]
MRSELVRLFQTLPHPCGYYADRTAQNLVIDPACEHLPNIYEAALAKGFRRAGGHVYRPHCGACRACIAARIPVVDFVPDRSQRRCMKRNADITVDVVRAEFRDEYFELYRRYLDLRHHEGGMDNPDFEDFGRFLYTAWSPTRFIEFRLDGRLVGIAVTDFAQAGLSAVYTFYDPQLASRGLGTYAILQQVEIAKKRNIPYVYLGFWIELHPKMDYKTRFRPLEILGSDGWKRMPAQP